MADGCAAPRSMLSQCSCSLVLRALAIPFAIPFAALAAGLIGVLNFIRILGSQGLACTRAALGALHARSMDLRDLQCCNLRFFRLPLPCLPSSCTLATSCTLPCSSCLEKFRAGACRQLGAIFCDLPRSALRCCTSPLTLPSFPSCSSFLSCPKLSQISLCEIRCCGRYLCGLCGHQGTPAYVQILSYGESVEKGGTPRAKAPSYPSSFLDPQPTFELDDTAGSSASTMENGTNVDSARTLGSTPSQTPRVEGGSPRWITPNWQSMFTPRLPAVNWESPQWSTPTWSASSWSTSWSMPSRTREAGTQHGEPLTPRTHADALTSAEGLSAITMLGGGQGGVRGQGPGTRGHVTHGRTPSSSSLPQPVILPPPAGKPASGHPNATADTPSHSPHQSLLSPTAPAAVHTAAVTPLPPAQQPPSTPPTSKPTSKANDTSASSSSRTPAAAAPRPDKPIDDSIEKLMRLETILTRSSLGGRGTLRSPRGRTSLTKLTPRSERRRSSTSSLSPRISPRISPRDAQSSNQDLSPRSAALLVLTAAQQPVAKAASRSTTQKHPSLHETNSARGSRRQSFHLVLPPAAGRPPAAAAPATSSTLPPPPPTPPANTILEPLHRPPPVKPQAHDTGAAASALDNGAGAVNPASSKPATDAMMDAQIKAVRAIGRQQTVNLQALRAVGACSDDGAGIGAGTGDAHAMGAGTMGAGTIGTGPVSLAMGASAMAHGSPAVSREVEQGEDVGEDSDEDLSKEDEDDEDETKASLFLAAIAAEEAHIVQEKVSRRLSSADKAMPDEDEDKDDHHLNDAHPPPPPPPPPQTLSPRATKNKVAVRRSEVQDDPELILFEVEVPPGVKEGDMLEFDIEGSGFHVPVPPGCGPGTILEVPMPRQAGKDTHDA
uniref:Uncharacterized protein n=1 Tax=Haptolina brevifila TaxID=156173 RepID=A0A7S2JHR4_9EUKA